MLVCHHWWHLQPAACSQGGIYAPCSLNCPPLLRSTGQGMAALVPPLLRRTVAVFDKHVP